MYKFKFADIGEGLHEGVVAEIYKKEGDIVKEGDSLFSVETDKITSDIPSPADGKIHKILMSEGDTIHVGDVIYHIDDGDDGKEGVNESIKDQNTSNQKEPDVKEPDVKEPDVKEPDVKEPDVKMSEETKHEEKAPSVVGDLEQSNNILDFSKFANDSNKSQTVQKIQKTQTSIQSNETYEWDVIIIGSGPGGYLAAEIAGKNGLRTLIIENKSLGGVCLNVGCIPTKTLLHSAKQYYYLKNGSRYGLDIDMNYVKLNWKTVMNRKIEVVSKLVNGVGTLLKMSKVTLIKGVGKLIDPHTVKVENKIYKGKDIIIATGSKPIELPLPGFEEARRNDVLISSTRALSLEKLPKSLVVIGGGVIGLEFATLYNEFGVNVTIIEGLSRLISPCDEEISAEATKNAIKLGIEVITNAKVVSHKDGKIQYEVDGIIKNIKCEKVLESIGRKPNINVVSTTEIEIGKKGEIVVDEGMHTNIRNVYAIGDVIGHAMLAHAAYRHAKIAINSILNMHDSYNPLHMPASIYTYPEISMVGQTEEQLKANNIDYLKVKVPNFILGKTLADGHPEGFTKLLFGKKYGEILGCHMINSNSSDIIGEVVAFMELEATIFDIYKSIHPHPSISETISEAAIMAMFVWKKANK